MTFLTELLENQISAEVINSIERAKYKKLIRGTIPKESLNILDIYSVLHVGPSPQMFSFKYNKVEGVHFFLDKWFHLEMGTVLWGNSQKEVHECIDAIIEAQYQLSLESSETSDVLWKSTFLSLELKNELESIIDVFLSSSDLYKTDLNIPWKTGIVLFGPPGNGKTRIIRAIGQKFGLKLNPIKSYLTPTGDLAIPTSSDISSYTNLFWEEYYYAAHPVPVKPNIIVAEDLDKTLFTGGKDAAIIRMTEFLNAIDGINPTEGSIIMATTNHPENLPEELLARPGRFDHLIKISLPDFNTLKEYFELSGIVTDIDLAKIFFEKKLSMAFAEQLVVSVKMAKHSHEVEGKAILGILEKIQKHHEEAARLCKMGKNHTQTWGF